MGSLVSTPRAPEPVIVPQPVPVQSESQAATTSPPEPEEPSAEEQASENRRRTLLARNRGRLGTIATSLQGFLTQAQPDNARKTLLGE